MSQTVASNAPLPGIEHIVVLMFENRSFDNVLGNLYPPSAAYNGIPPGASNTYTGLFENHTVDATTTPPSGNSIDITPFPDPGESASDIQTQIYNGQSAANMGGFAQNYHDVHLLAATPGDIMCYFDMTVPDLPASFLAASFAVSDQWFASAPVQTFANRMFSICGMAGQFGNTAPQNDTDYFGEGQSLKYFDVLGSVTNQSIFQLLDGTTGCTSVTPDPTNWKVYFHDIPFTALHCYVNEAWNNGSPCVSSYNDGDYDPPYGTTFAADVAANALPAFAIIEPRYWGNYSTNGTIANSNHPGTDNYLTAGLLGGNPINVLDGEGLLFDVIFTLASNVELFASTLLIVVYDEHGGCYDHVPPPAAENPYAASVDNAPTYSNFGVRVPAMFVNGFIDAGTVYRPPSSASYPFDHTSIIATVRAQFGLSGSLTARDQNAPVLSGLISQSAAMRRLEERIPASLKTRLDALPKPVKKPGPRKPMEEHRRMLGEWLRAKDKKR